MPPGLRLVQTGLNVTLDGQLVADIKSIAAAVKAALPTVATPATKAA